MTVSHAQQAASSTDWLPNNPDKETLLNWVNSGFDKVVLLKARSAIGSYWPFISKEVSRLRPISGNF